MNLKQPRAGRYLPTCPRCGQRFVLVVSDEPGVPPVASKPPADDAAGGLEKTFVQGSETGCRGPDGPNLDTNFVLSSGADGGCSETPGESSADPLAGDPLAGGPPSPPPPKSPGRADRRHESSLPGVPSPARLRGAGPGSKPGRVTADPAAFTLPYQLGGYRLQKELGRGGMGAVYLARQLSLDRPVALKVMNTGLAAEPRLRARFLREAYAAAQLVHHNVVQIYDIGTEAGLHYFSMEYVDGETLGQILRRAGRLPPATAAGYVLQAARGLRFAHERGIVHRDVKPDNLILNSHGVIKVADLGLVKIRRPDGLPGSPVPVPVVLAAGPPADPPQAKPTPGPTMPMPVTPLAAASANVTQANLAMGTPAYMAPEQAFNPSTVDARADIYSLGCTLYVMLTGKPLFDGTTALEVLSKHAFDPIVPPDRHVKDVPRALSAVVEKMLAKAAEDRYQSMAEVVAQLETFLQVPRTDGFQPGQAEEEELRACVRGFEEAPARRLRRRTFSVLGLAGLGLIGACFAAHAPAAAAIAGVFAVLTALAYVLLTGLLRHSYLVLRSRELAATMTRGDLFTAVVGGGLGLLTLLLFQLLAAAVFLSLTAVLLAGLLHLLLDRSVVEQEREPLARGDALLRTLRARGVAEDALRRFVCQHAGQGWEGFYEALFGYEAVRSARAEWDVDSQGRPRARWGDWRDPIVAWIDRKIQTRHEAQERRLIKEAEKVRLEAEGVSAAEAQARADREAKVLAEQASQIRHGTQTGPVRSPTADIDFASLAPVRRVPLVKRLRAVLAAVFPAKLRFLAGALLLAGFAAWVRQNDLLAGVKLPEPLEPGHIVLAADVPEVTRPLSIPGVPAALTAPFDGINAGVAGLVLVLSSFSESGVLGLGAAAGAVVILFGTRMGIQAAGPAPGWVVSLGVGIGLAWLGRYLRGPDEDD